MTRVLFVGLGSAGRRHLRLLGQMDRTLEFIAYRSGKAPESVDGVTSFTDFEEALRQEPDIAFITNPPNLHVETATKCAEAGCDLFIEKPLSNTLKGIPQLISLVEDRKLVTMMGCQLRYHPVLVRARKILSTGFGPVHSFRIVCGSRLPEWRPGRDYRETYSASREQGGGVVLDLIHELDYTDWLLTVGKLETAKCGSVSSLDIETEDVAEIVLRAKSGGLGTIHLDYFRPVARRTFEIIGEDSVLTGDLLGGTLERTGIDSEDLWTFDCDRDDLHRAQLRDFFDHVDRRDLPENDVHQGSDILELALTARNQS